MVIATFRKSRAQTGARPFDVYRDSKPVAELMSVAFGGKLGPDGEIALAEMLRAARWGWLLGWLYWPGWDRSGIAPGFVWVEQGRVTGNVSLRRARGWGGFFIGNVAVHPDWRGRGIASALMERALEAISAHGGRWVGLEVRADNQTARRLYERLGFREVGKTTYMLRPAGLPRVSPPSHPALRRGRSHDGAALFELVHASVAIPHRPLLELRKENYEPKPGWERPLDYWLEGRREVWWVIEDGDVICGAVRALHERGRRPDQLEVLVAPGYSGRVETALVQRGMACLRSVPSKMVEVVLTAPTDSLVAALEEVGFQKLRVLVQMRLDIL
jgi:ribosomal protein S18 acetylase RimI-like enzyme